VENIDHMGKNSLESLARNNISEQNKRHLAVDIVTGIAGLTCLAAGLTVSWIQPESTVVPSLIYTLGFIIESLPIFIEAFRGLFTKNFTRAMEILVAIAISACFFSGELIPALLIPIILNVSHLLEERSIMGGREAIEGLKLLQQKTASLILEDGSTQRVDSRSLEPGQRVLVTPGAGIPADGVILEGESNIDQKSMTGEPEPYFAGPGDKVFAGTFNIDGTLKIEVRKKYSDTSFSSVLKLIEESESISIPESRLVDRFMKYYIPLVLAIAAAVALIEKDLSRAIAILVVSCPCGQMLVTSAPMVAALSAATKRGILIKNSKFLEELNHADTVVFDKTGTLTGGEMTVTEIIPYEGADISTVLDYAASVSSGSSHPISAAVMRKAGRDYGKIRCEIRETSGKGLTGTCEDGRVIRFGRRSWIEELCTIAVPEGFASDNSGSLSFVCCDNTLLGAVAIGDSIRSDAEKCVCELRELGVGKTVMLTGDRIESAEKIRIEAGVNEVYASLLPEDKLSHLRTLSQTGTVIAVGDGINDAPVLREAQVGIAMGAMGSDLAIQSADIALMNNNLMNIPFAISLASKTRRIIYENLILSMTVSALMIILSSFGFITAIVGALAHNVGAFGVILNSSRILRHK